MIKTENLVDMAIASQERLKRERTGWWISQIGTCPTGQYLERLGVTPDTPLDMRTLRVFHVGNVFEDWILDLLEEQKDVTLERQVRVESKELSISGKIDAVVQEGEEVAVVEVKSKHSRAFWYMVDKKEGANRHHLIQTWLYLHLTGIKRGRITYISKDDLCIAEFEVDRDDPELAKEALGTIDTLNAAWAAQKPPMPPGWTWVDDVPVPQWKQRLDKKTGIWRPVVGTYTDWRANYCSYHNQCAEIFANQLYLK